MSDTIVEVSKSAKTADGIGAVVTKQFEAALAKAQAMPQTQIAGPLNWWDFYAIGPIQPGLTTMPPAPFGSSQVLPNKIVKLGSPAFVATVLYLNPFYPSPALSAAGLLSELECPYEINYYLGELENWVRGPAQVSTHQQFVAGQSIYVDVMQLQNLRVGLYDLNITVRIMNCNGQPLTPFAGFCTAVYDLDDVMPGFGPGPGWRYEQSIRFMVYE